MYNPEYTKHFYNVYGDHEWSRLEATAYGRLQAIIHADFIRRHIKPGARVLDAGSGPGRFSTVLARLGAKVTVLDISSGQLSLARQKLTEADAIDRVEQFIEGDICDLSRFPNEHFDAVVCFGGALSYVCEQRQKAADELVRVTKRGGAILVSVMSRLGAILLVVRGPFIPSLIEPDVALPERPGLWDVLQTGTFPGFPSKRAGITHAAMHLYTAGELESLFGDCHANEIAGSNVVERESSSSTLEQISADPRAWSTLVDLERKLNTDPGLVNSGSHIIMAARRSL